MEASPRLYVTAVRGERHAYVVVVVFVAFRQRQRTSGLNSGASATLPRRPPRAAAGPPIGASNRANCFGARLMENDGGGGSILPAAWNPVDPDTPGSTQQTERTRRAHIDMLVPSNHHHFATRGTDSLLCTSTTELRFFAMDLSVPWNANSRSVIMCSPTGAKACSRRTLPKWTLMKRKLVWRLRCVGDVYVLFQAECSERRHHGAGKQTEL